MTAAVEPVRQHMDEKAADELGGFGVRCQMPDGRGVVQPHCHAIVFLNASGAAAPIRCAPLVWQGNHLHH